MQGYKYPFKARKPSRKKNPLILFLSYILPSMDRFECSRRVTRTQHVNCTLKWAGFWKCTQPTFWKDMWSLQQGTTSVLSAYLTKTSFPMKTLVLEQGHGLILWSCKLKLLFPAVRKVCVATINKMLQKFPFGDPLLKDLGILRPEKTASYSFDRIQYHFHNLDWQVKLIIISGKNSWITHHWIFLQWVQGCWWYSLPRVGLISEILEL